MTREPRKKSRTKKATIFFIEKSLRIILERLQH